MARIYKTEEVIELFKKKHGDRYDYSKFIYPGRKNDKGIVICKEHGEFLTSKQYHLNGCGCPTCAGVPTGGFKRKTHEQFMVELEEKYTKFHEYDFSKFVYKNNNTKGVVICPKHGDFELSPKKMLTRNDGCSECSGRKKLTLDVIQQKIDQIHGEGKYTIPPNQEYKNNKTKIKISCSIHGEWTACVGNLINLKQRCPACAGMISKIENELKDFVTTLDSNIESGKFDFIPPYQVDILSHQHKIGIEMNGLLFHSEYDKKKSNEYHINKTNDCENNGYDLIHIFEDEWNNKQDICKSILSYKFKKCPNKIYARKCDIRIVDKIEIHNFLDDNNIFGRCENDLGIGLYFKDKLISLLTLVEIEDGWKISSFTNLNNHHCVGGFGKMLRFFINHYNPCKITASVDKRFFKGDVLQTNGFMKIEDSPINYYLFNKHEMVRYKPEIFNGLTTKYPKESYYKIWDCGYYNYVWYKNEETRGSSAPRVSDF